MRYSSIFIKDVKPKLEQASINMLEINSEAMRMLSALTYLPFKTQGLRVIDAVCDFNASIVAQSDINNLCKTHRLPFQLGQLPSGDNIIKLNSINSNQVIEKITSRYRLKFEWEDYMRTRRTEERAQPSI